MANLRGVLNTDKSTVSRLSSKEINSRLATWEREVYTGLTKDGGVYISITDLNTGKTIAS